MTGAFSPDASPSECFYFAGIGKKCIDGGVSGFFCRSGVDGNWNQRGVVWQERRSIALCRMVNLIRQTEGGNA